MATLAVGQVLPYLAVHLCVKCVDDDDENKLRVNLVWWGVAGTTAAFSAAAGALYAVMDKKYLKIFFTTTTGAQFIVESWRDGKTDGARLDIFMKHRTLWAGAAGEVRAWTLENYARWEEPEPRPDWWNDVIKSNIEDDFIPPRFRGGVEGGVEGGGEEGAWGGQPDVGAGAAGTAKVAPLNPALPPV